MADKSKLDLFIDFRVTAVTLIRKTCQQELTCLKMYFTFMVSLKNFLPHAATADRCVVAALFLGRRDVRQRTSSMEIGSRYSCQPIASIVTSFN